MGGSSNCAARLERVRGSALQPALAAHRDSHILIRQGENTPENCRIWELLLLLNLRVIDSVRGELFRGWNLFSQM